MCQFYIKKINIVIDWSRLGDGLLYMFKFMIKLLKLKKSRYKLKLCDKFTRHWCNIAIFITI